MLNNRYLPALLSLMALVGLILVGWQLFSAAPAWQYQKTLTLSPSTTVWKLGYSELGQHNVASAADHQHAQLRYDPTSGWWLANLSATKGLLYQYANAAPNADHLRLRHWQLAQGDEIQLDQIRLTVQALDAEHLVLLNQATQQQAEWRKGWFSGALVVTGEKPFEGCDDDLQGFYLGGNVQCATRWRLTDTDAKAVLPPQAASITLSGGHFVLRPLAPETAFHVIRAGQSIDLMAMEVPLVAGEQRIQEIIVGKTAYAIAVDKADVLRLTATKGIHLFDPAAAAEGSCSGHLELAAWQPEPVTLAVLWDVWTWTLGLGGVFLVSILLAYMVALDRQANRQSPQWARHVLLLALPLVALWAGLIWENHLPVLASITAITGVGLTLLLWRQGLLYGIAGWVWLGVLLLAGIGLLVQMQLATGADNIKWQRFANLQAQVLLAMAWFVTVLALFPARLAVKRWEASILNQNGQLRTWLNGLPAVITLGLLVLLQTGGEGGVNGFQPAEIAKLVMALLLAIVMVTWVDLRTQFAETHRQVQTYHALHWWQSPRWWVRGRLLFWAILLWVLGSIMLGAVRDFSPAVILCLLAAGFVWAMRPWLSPLLRRLVWSVPLLAVGLLVAAWHYPVFFATVLERLQGERILVWVNPWAYPDLGLQAQRSLEAIQAAGWWRWDWFGNNGDLMTIPAVQNDFILAFVLAKVGAFGGLLILLLQLAWVGLLFGLHARLLAGQLGGRSNTQAVQLLAWWLYGLAWLQITHWLISWGNVLGLLPIMGQPMTWISSGNSHLLALGLPTVLLALLAARYLQVRGEG